jgi:hypothetical protein
VILTFTCKNKSSIVIEDPSMLKFVNYCLEWLDLTNDQDVKGIKAWEGGH